MRTLRRTLVALAASLVGLAAVRLRGSGGTPPRRGGWRELPASEIE